MKFSAMLLALMSVAGHAVADGSGYKNAPAHYRAQLIRVVDGDTFDVFVDRRIGQYSIARVRLFGIDCPEVRTRDLKEKAAGRAATELVSKLLTDPDGSPQTIHLGKWHTRLQVHGVDSFGRWLANVLYVSDSGNSADLGRALIDAKLCRETTKKRWR